MSELGVCENCIACPNCSGNGILFLPEDEPGYDPIWNSQSPCDDCMGSGLARLCKDCLGAQEIAMDEES